MKTLPALLITASLWQVSAIAQEHPLPDRTAFPPNGRYEIVQSPVLQKLTFILDRYEGMVWQIVVDAEGQESWELMQVLSPPVFAASANRPKEPRFQIFVSGRMARSTFLLDCSTGRVWQDVVDKDGVSLWQPMTFSGPFGGVSSALPSASARKARQETSEK